MALNTIREEARDIPVVSSVDVVVVGGGAAGLSAAIGAARGGSRVALVERLGFLGGCITATMMDVLWMFRAGGRPGVEGIGMEILRRLKERGGVDGEPGYRVYVDSEMLKLLADDMVEEAGIELWLGTLGCWPVMEDGTVAGVIIESKSGRQAIKAKAVVDASGDGDIAARAGAPFEMGRPGDGKLQPVGNSFRLTNVNLEGMRSYYREYPEDIYFARLVKAARERGDFKVERNAIILHGIRPWGELTGINATRYFVDDPTDARQMSKAEVEVRRQVYQVADFLKENVPGFEKSEVSYMGTQCSARESRRFLGEYVLTADDVVGGSTFEDAIAKHPCFIDLHSPSGNDIRFVYPKPERPEDDSSYLAFTSGDPSCRFETLIQPGRIPRRNTGDNPTETAPAALFDIPYRCLLPSKVEGILTAGRCISATHEAVASIRYLSASFATGQAAGVAASMAALGNVLPRQVDVKALQQRLVDQGAYLG